MLNKYITYEEYHNKSLEVKDIDPSVLCLKYLSNRFELNIEQCYWIAFLYATCYSAVTVFYIYNEFPDYSNISINRLREWWDNNKNNLLFQTDRLRIKSNNQFVEMVQSYKSIVGDNQQKYFKSNNLKEIYNKIISIKYVGRFSLFNYLDVLNQITDVNIKPKYLNMIEAESCRNGICYAINKSDWINKKLNANEYKILHNQFLKYLKELQGDVFQIETTLCAYKKYRQDKRYIGFYIERMRKEIKHYENTNIKGIAWECLWQFRAETFNQDYLNEK